jgi:hypothetical protein
MVVELLSQKGWGGLGFGMDFLRREFSRQYLRKPTNSRPWCFVQVASSQGMRGASLYAPALPWELRKAVAERKLFWVSAPESLAPEIVRSLLESSLCEGVFCWGIERFGRFTSAALWSRRWQLAAEKGGTHFFWLHEHAQDVMGFELRLHWTGPGAFEMKRGYGLIEGTASDVGKSRRTRFPDPPAA